MLDIDVYPHLVDLVFDLAPHDALLRLRTASKDFRVMADALLVADRIILSAPTTWPSELEDGTTSIPPSMPVIVSSTSGRIPAFAAMARGAVFNPEAHDLRLTRVVDFVGLRTLRPEPPRISCTRSAIPPPNPCDILAAPSLDSSRLTVRFMHNLTGDDRVIGSPRSIAGSPDTTVLFTPLPLLFSDHWQAPDLLSWPPIGDVPLRRAVVNLYIHPDDTAPELVMKPVDAPEVVWVFHRAASPFRQPPAGRTETLEGMLFTLMYAIIVPLDDDDVRVTVAGLETFAGWPGWEPEAEETEWQGLVRHFLILCKQPMGWSFSRLKGVDTETALSRIAFKTLAQLREELGPERAGIETMESGSLGP
jgi:hypothetical protein